MPNVDGFLPKAPANVPTLDVIFVTLGLIEAWYDHETNLYINTPARP